MASVGDSGSGGRRSLDAEINLTSFIDLLSVCVCFLLVSAVWVQIGSLEVKQNSGAEGPVANLNQWSWDVSFNGPNQLKVEIKKGSKTLDQLKIISADAATLPKLAYSELETWMKKNSAQSTDIAHAFVHAKANVDYGEMVKVLDVLRSLKVTNLGVVPPEA